LNPVLGFLRDSQFDSVIAHFPKAFEQMEELVRDLVSEPNCFEGMNRIALDAEPY
jgi:hypothetical protein